MKVAIIYKSMTGNTAALAHAIEEALRDETVYCGEPKDDLDADFYFVGSWTDKGMCCEEIAEFLRGLENKTIAYFGTAGFGGSQEYYDALFERVKGIAPDSNEIKGGFYCQGKMPLGVRKRYEAQLAENPGDARANAGIENFDKALSHPDSKDFDDVRAWAENLCCL